jgi:hypothetical protein
MRHCTAAVLFIVIATSPPAAIAAGVGIQAGGVGIGANAGVGRTGTSIGIGASVGGLGGATAAASVGGTGNGSIGGSVGTSGRLGGASIGASGRLGGASGGLSAGGGGTTSSASSAGTTSSASSAASATPGAGPSRSAAASRGAGSSTAGGTATVAPVDGVRQSITLPPILLPSGRSDRASAATAVDEPGTPAAVVRACRDAVESAATPFGVVSVRARSAGSLRRLGRGAVSAPVQVRIHYARQGGAEIRQARIRCNLDATGKVIKLT